MISSPWEHDTICVPPASVMKRACFPIRQSAFGSHGIKQPVVPLYPSSLPWKKKRKTAESHRIQPSNAIPLTNTPLTWRWWHLPPRSTLLLLRFGSFLFLVYCVASRQSLHVFPWKPFCLLSIFLHYLPLPSAFQYVYFPPPFDFIFSHPPFLCISRCTLLPLF